MVDGSNGRAVLGAAVRATLGLLWMAQSVLAGAGPAPHLTLTKEIESSSNGGASQGSPVNGFEDHWVGNDAGDVLHFKLTITNDGNAPAFNTGVQDRFTQNAVAGQGYVSCTLDSVQSMDGGIAYTTTGNLFTGTLTLVKTIPNNGDMTTDPNEIVCIRYHCTVDPLHAPGSPIDNCAEIKNYAAFDAGTNLATSEVPHCAEATLTEDVALDKQITGSSIPDTTPDNVINQGEILDYSILVTLGEGTYHNFGLTDDQTSIGAVTCGSGGFTCSGNVSAVGSTVTVAATTGSSQGTITYVYSKQQSAGGTNTATVDSSDTAPVTDSTTWTKVDPAPHIVVGTTPTSGVPGDPVTATFTWSNPGNPLYQCTVTSVLDPVLWDTTAPNVVLGSNPSGWTFTYDAPSHTITGTFAPTTSPCTDASIMVTLQIGPNVVAGGSYPLTATYSGSSLPSGHPNQGAGGTFSDSDTATITIPPYAFVDATKTVVDLNGGTVLPGDTLEYTVTLINTLAPVTNVVFTDTVPAHTTYVPSTITSSKGTTHVSGAVLSVDGFGLATSETVTITFRVTVDAGTAAGTIISNQGSVSSTQTPPEPTDADGNDANGDQPTDVIVGGGPPPATGLTAQKIVNQKTDADMSGSNTPGDTMTYSVVITNASSVTVTNVTFSDTIPSGLTYVAATAAVVPSSGNMIDVTGAAVTATIASIAANSSVTLSWDITIDAPLVNFDADAAKEVFTNQGTIDSDQTTPHPTDADGIPENGDQPTKFTAVPSGAGAPDVDLQKTVRLFNDVDADGLYDPGDTAEYKLVLTNNGSAAATAVVIGDTIPTNTTLVVGSVVTSQGTVTTTNPISIDVGTVNPGGIVTVIFRVTVNAGVAEGTIVSNQANADGGNFQTVPSDNDGNPNNGRNPTTFPVDNDADLAIVKTSSPNPATVGSPLTYTLTVTNNGPDAALSVTVTDPLPGTVTFVSATPSQGNCSGTTTVTCSLGTIAASGSATITIVVTPTAEGTLSNTATVGSPTSDPVPGNNSDNEMTPVSAGVDLQLSKTATPANPAVGDTITYTLVATNNGPGTATGVTVTDPLPAQVTYQSSSTTQGSCSEAAGTVTCAIGTLAADASATVTILVTRNSAGAFTNIAAIDGDQTDPTPGNNGPSHGFPPAGTPEICNNCLDDDGDGMVDAEDPDCCAQTTYTVDFAKLRSKKAAAGNGKLSMKAHFDGGAFDDANPLTEGMTVQIRNDQGKLLVCCAIEASHWMVLVKHNRHLGFWDDAMQVCPPIKDIDFTRPRNKGAWFAVRTGPVSFADYLHLLNLTVRVGDRCASGGFTPRRTR